MAATWWSSASRRKDWPLVRAESVSYVELHCHSAYSFLDGASAPEELAARAAELGYQALALTDHDGVWGAMEFAQACKAFGVRPIVGAELTVMRRHARLRLRCRRVVFISRSWSRARRDGGISAG